MPGEGTSTARQIHLQRRQLHEEPSSEMSLMCRGYTYQHPIKIKLALELRWCIALLDLSAPWLCFLQCMFFPAPPFANLERRFGLRCIFVLLPIPDIVFDSFFGVRKSLYYCSIILVIWCSSVFRFNWWSTYCCINVDFLIFWVIG